ncbi:RHS repeat-associated core domain-containing protein [Paraburkholderia phenoliruptrix]|uniref:RHS repeat-associated core domain-containing protein n=1 Tax=Paraburkholderia phenoliruptrix TaxID=252970 RepID=UPI003209B078
MLHHRNRYYQPATRRFISEGPTGWASGQTNAYAYVNGNPVQFNNTTGEAGPPMNGPANA